MIGQRLKHERERLGMTQPGLAAIAGVGKTTVINWEKGVSSPTTVQLAALSEVGVDVFYVLTGQRTSMLIAAEPAAPYGPQLLKPDEAALLDNYRHSPPEAQAALRATSAALAQSAEVKPTRKGSK